jgi:predicted permease
MSVRAALGATRIRLVQQMLAESLLLSACGSAVGLPLAIWATKALASLRAFNIPLLQTATVDGAALAFTLMVGVSTAILFGTIPAFHLSGMALDGGLKENSRGSTAGSKSARMRDTLVIAEVAMACMLLVGAGLFLRSLIRLLNVDLGFQPAHVLAWRIDTSRHFTDRAQESIFYDDLVQRIEKLPGVESVGLTDTLPLGRNRSWIAGAKGETYRDDQAPVAFPRIVDAGYLRTMLIPLRAGRMFDAQDKPQNEPALVINEKMANNLWPGKAAVGQVAVVNGNDFRVIGVVENVRHTALEAEASPEMYLLGAQRGWGSMELVVRARGSLKSFLPNVRAVLRQVDPNLPAAQFQTLREIVDQATSPRRFITFLLAAFAFSALILAALGIYGVIAHSVGQRCQEIGIRLALGASPQSILLLILRQGISRVLWGLGLGLVGTFALTRVLANMLYEVKATDPLTFLWVIALLFLVALLACFLPARRATRIDPVAALRSE